MDHSGRMDVLGHLRLLAQTRLESLQHSLFHLEDTLPALVAEYSSLIEQHKAAIQYELSHIERLDAHVQGAPFVLPGEVAPPGVPTLAAAAPAPAPAPPMTNELGVQAQAHVATQTSNLVDAQRFAAAVPIPQSKMQAVFYERGDVRPPEAITGHMATEPRSAEELIAERDANRKQLAEATKEKAPADVASAPALPELTPSAEG